MAETHPLVRIRTEQGMSRESLAAAADVSVSSIARVEQDTRIAYGRTLSKLAAALGVSVRDIAGPNQRELADEIIHTAEHELSLEMSR